MGYLPYNKNMTERAKQLRRDMTPQERKLWYMFLRKYPVKMYKQRVIDSYIVDFYCPAAKLVIELDGSQHYTDEGIEYDEKRSEVLQAMGVKVIRIPNNFVNEKFSAVCEAIDFAIKERL